MSSNDQGCGERFIMALQVCGYSRQVALYAACSLEDSEAECFDSHLQECDQCRQALASVIEDGAGPEWLSLCRGEMSRDESPLDEQVPAELIDDASDVARGSLVDDAKAEQRLVNRRYRLMRRVGEGGMGVVWEAWDTVMRRRVALKELRGGGNRSRQGLRLLQEASSLARLSHPNIVAVFELFMTDEQPKMVMEFVDGPTLSQWCGDRVIAERQAATLLESLALAAQHAHDNGIVHRDLKPSNVLLSFPRDQSDVHVNLSLATPKLSDFGLARIADDPSLTQAGDLIGTPAFMAPEQALGDVALVGPVTDVYGLGATLYHLLTGTAPHVAEDPVATVELVRNHDPIPPRLLRPELSRDIETICMKCLRKAPSERYASATALAADLRAYLDGRAIAARPQSRLSIAARWCRRHKLQASSLFAALGLLVALVLGAVIFAKTERALRKEADEATQNAFAAKAMALQETERAEAATQQVQEHFRVTMGAVESIVNLLNVASAAPNGFPSDALENLRGNAIAIYEEFLKSLPEHDQWTYRDISIALRHAELIVQHSPERLVEGRQRLEALKSVIQRFEREHPEQEETYMMRDWYLRTAAGFADRAGDYLVAAQGMEERAHHLKRWTMLHPQDVLRFHEYRLSLHYAAIHSLKGGNREEATRLVNQSTEVARQLVARSDGAEEDRVNYLHELALKAKCARSLNDEDELRAVRGTVRELQKSFDESSPRYGEVHGVLGYVEHLCQGLAEG